MNSLRCGVLNGNRAVLARLYDEHHLHLFRFAWRLTGSVADAQDIVQECFLALLRPECSFDERRTSVRTYLLGIVRNQASRRFRRREDSLVEAERGSDSQSPEMAALQSEMENRVARAVLALPETQREILILAHYEQLPVAEIAEVVGINVGAVKSRLQRARASLRETLAECAEKLP